MTTEYHLDLPKEEIDAVLRTKRKAREPKACYPCHSRKVKCDRKLPCDSCIKRDHADLCTYERPLKRRQLPIKEGTAEGDEGPLTATTRSESPTHTRTSILDELGDRQVQQIGTRVSMPKEQYDKMCEELRIAQETIARLRDGQVTNMEQGNDQSSSTDRPEDSERGVHAETGRMGTVHLGSRSVLAYMIGLGRSRSSQDAAKTVLEENVLPKLGLDNETATYPFVDLWSTDANTNDVNGLCLALPDDRICREFFTFYRDVACTIYPVVYDCLSFESQMEIMLHNRTMAQGVYVSTGDGPERPFGVSISWLGLLFAVLASGSQSSNLPAKERELTSQVYVCCAYQALRMTNFMSYPSLESIQTLLIICNVLAYNMNPGNAYIVLGMTLRIATALGLQTDSHRFSPQELYARRRVWWALAWQDSHFSVSYDRPTGTALAQPEIPYKRGSTPGNRSYPESMFQIISVTLEIIRSRIFNPKATMPLATILGWKDRVARIVSDGAPHLRDRDSCTSHTQHLERLALKLHANYITAELCRSVIKGPTNVRPRIDASGHGSPDADVMAGLRRDFVRGLTRTITAFVELHSISTLAARSWIGIQRAISSAFLLAMLDESRTDTKVHGLLRSLEEVIAERMNLETDLWGTSAEMSSPYGASTSSGHSSRGNSFSGPSPSDPPQWAKSMSSSLKALGKLNNVLADHKSATTAAAAIQQQANMPLPGGLNYAPSASFDSGLPLNPTHNPAALLLNTSKDGLITPVTPDSSSSSDWNATNIVERAGQFVQAPLWG